MAPECGNMNVVVENLHQQLRWIAQGFNSFDDQIFAFLLVFLMCFEYVIKFAMLVNLFYSQV